MKKVIFSIVLLLLLGVISFAVFGQNVESNASKPIVQASVKQSLEEFLKQNNVTGDVAKAYRIAYENPQNVLSTVKCYCGCLEQDHKNNRDCFINEDGSFDLMGLNCGLCVKTAIVSDQMLAEGKSIQEISDYVDAKWGKN